MALPVERKVFHGASFILSYTSSEIVANDQTQMAGMSARDLSPFVALDSWPLRCMRLDKTSKEMSVDSLAKNALIEGRPFFKTLLNVSDGTMGAVSLAWPMAPGVVHRWPQ